MSKNFKYDVVQLIRGVSERPCLWDKTIESYKDRVERRAAWEEIFGILDDGYEEMTPEEKRITGEHVLNKWTNIRDTFVKTLKSKMGKPKKKYLFHDELKFLTKVVPEEDDYPDEAFMKLETEELETTNYKRKSKKKDYDDYVPPKKVKDTVDYESNRDTSEVDFAEVDGDPRLMNEDEAFFASLLPSVVKYNEDERLEFRMEVLTVMKRIKDKRKWPAD